MVNSLPTTTGADNQSTHKSTRIYKFNDFMEAASNNIIYNCSKQIHTADIYNAKTFILTSSS